MAGFFYWFDQSPNAADGKARLAETELGVEFPEGEGLSWSQVRAGGPGRGDGVLAVRGVSADRFGAARWVQVPELHIGWLPKEPPGPAGLARREVYGGHAVRLLDGREWVVPALPLLPHSYSIDADGQTVSRPAARFAELTGAGDRIFNSLLKQVEAQIVEQDEGKEAAQEFLDALPADARLSDQEGLGLSIQALRLNYSITRTEALALELLDERNVFKVLMALIDWPTIKNVGLEMAAAAQKKSPAPVPAG